MRAVTLLLLLAGSAAGADVRFPERPVAPPQPLPAKDAPTVVGTDELFVFESDAECFTRCLPGGVLLVTHEAGPLRVRAKFVGGNGKTETRTFRGPHVYIVEGSHAGTADLLVIPKGLTDDKQIEQRTLTVGGPRPPPDPIDPPKPLPDGRFKLAAFTFGEVTKSVPATGRAPQAAALATAYRGVVVSTANRKPEEILRAAKSASDAALGDARATWDAFGVALQDKLYALYQSKTLVTSADFADALTEIATGLDAVK